MSKTSQSHPMGNIILQIMHIKIIWWWLSKKSFLTVGLKEWNILSKVQISLNYVIIVC